jgi:hypothetical protein
MAEPKHRFASNPAACDRYVLCPDVVLMPFEDGTAQLLDLDGSFFGLSETAAKMLKGVLEQSEPDTTQRIAVEYNADLDRVRADLASLLASLRANGLIRRSDDRPPGVRLRTAIAITISYPALRILGLVRNQRLKTLSLLALARLCFVLAGWARTVEAWRKCLRTSQVVAASSERERLIDTIDSEVRRSASDLPSVACKERALCCWFMLRSAGVPARLVLGVQFLPFSGHCWCEVDHRILTDLPESCNAYTPVICYDG